jgi:ABC-type transport system involved in multi-copper enzyme maturation permease subunit
MNLLVSELSRFRSRRAVVLLLAAGFVLSVVITSVTLWNNRPLTESDFADAQAQVDQQVAACQDNPRQFGLRERQIQQCERIFGDASMYEGRYIESFDQLSQGLPLSLMTTMAFVALLAGTSFVGADFASGSLSNTLLFRPNRWQVWLAKIAATGLWLTLVAAITVVLCLGALAIVGANVDGTQPTSDQLATLTKRGVAIMTVVVAAGVLGAALTTALRATIATAGIVIGYLLVGEALLRGLADEEVTPWLASTRINALVTSPLRLFSYNEATGEEKVTLLYLWPSAAYLGVLFAIVLALCAVVFARRDVP